jgi:hypothetical protein
MKLIKYFFISFFIFVVLRILFITNFWQNIEHKASDVFFIIRGEREISGDIVIVGIGDDTFSTLNERWPFPRTYHAKLIENLEKAGVSQIIYDIEFTERTNIDADSKLAATIAKYDNIILSGKLIRTQYNGSIREQFLSPIPILTQTDTKWGTVNISSDIDGFVRRYDLFQKRAKEIKLSIGTIAMAQRYQLDLNSEDIHNYSKYFQIGSKYIPKATSRSAFINYFGPTGTFTTYDFADVIDDSTFTTNFEKELNLFKFGILKTFTYSSGPNWGYDDWVDGAFICDEEFLEALDYTIPNTFIDDFTGSGVGKYMSRIIDEYGFIVDYRGALLKHIGNDDSKLNPKIRKKQPLKDDENEWK